MDENNKPNLEELRRLRLAFLDGGGKAGSVTSLGAQEDATNDNQKPLANNISSSSSSNNNNNNKKIATNKESPTATATSSNDDVIDLLDSDSETDSPLSRKRKARAAADNHDDDEIVIMDSPEKPPPKKKKKSKSKNSCKTTTDSSAAVVAAAATPTTATKRFQICSYNIWFGPSGDGSPHAGARMQAIVRLLAQEHSTENPMWFVGLQEVTLPLLKLLGPLLQKNGYRLFMQPLNMVYGVGLAVRQEGGPKILDHGWAPFRHTQMDRGALFARCQLPNSDEEIFVATTHLESFASKEMNGASTRALQLTELKNFCMEQTNKHMNLKTAVFCGDLNWDDERKNPDNKNLLESLDDAKWKDAWKETSQDRSREEQKGFTYDQRLNPMFKGGSLRRRFDRCIVYRKDGTNVARTTRLIGSKEIPGLTWSKKNPFSGTTSQARTAPSDHFGLVTHLDLGNYM